MRKMARLAIALLAMGTVSDALACSSSSVVSVSFSSSPVSIGSWNPLDPADTPSTSFTVTVTRASSNPNTDYALVYFSDPDTGTPIRVGSNGGFVGPQYSIKSGAADVAFATGTPQPSPLQFTFANGNSQSAIQRTLNFSLLANSQGSDFSSGTYSENLGMTVQCFKSNGTSQGSYSTLGGLNLAVTIPNRLTVVTAGPQTIDFGAFTTTTQNLAVSLKSTGSINANISTANHNQMVLAGAQSPYPANSVIGYSMSFDGQNVPSAGANLTNLARAGVSGASKSLVLTLPGQPTGKLAGTYSDIITVILSPGS